MPFNHLILCHPLPPSAFCKYTPLKKKKSQILSMCAVRPDLGEQLKSLVSSSSVRKPWFLRNLVPILQAPTHIRLAADAGSIHTKSPSPWTPSADPFLLDWSHLSTCWGASKWEDVAHEPSLGFLSKTASIFPIYLPLPLPMACHFQD